MIKRTLVFSQPTYLSTRYGQLVVNYPNSNQKAQSVPIEDLGLVLLENQQITFSHGLINQLLANKAVIITCDGKHMPSGLIVPLVGHSLQSRRFQEQLL